MRTPVIVILLNCWYFHSILSSARGGAGVLISRLLYTHTGVLRGGGRGLNFEFIWKFVMVQPEFHNFFGKFVCKKTCKFWLNKHRSNQCKSLKSLCFCFMQVNNGVLVIMMHFVNLLSLTAQNLWVRPQFYVFIFQYFTHILVIFDTNLFQNLIFFLKVFLPIPLNSHFHQTFQWYLIQTQVEGDG